MVFQDLISAVNPRRTVREILREPMRHLLSLTKLEQQVRASEMIRAVDLDGSILDKRPPQLSGGQLQRVCLARCFCHRVMVMYERQIVETQTVGIALTISSDAGRLLQNTVLPAFPLRSKGTKKG